MIAEPFPRRWDFQSKAKMPFDADWKNIAIIDDETGEEIKRVYCYDLDQSVVLSYIENENGDVFVCNGEPPCSICQEEQFEQLPASITRRLAHPAAARLNGPFHLARRDAA